MTQRIAVVEDEPMMNDLICFVLNNAGFKTVSYTSARAAQAGPNRQFDLWLLDIMLETPTAGLDLMKAVRKSIRIRRFAFYPRGTASWIRLPVWKLAAMTTLPSRFPKKELVLRITNILRRTAPATAAKTSSELLQAGRIKDRLALAETVVAGELINLTAKEFDLILLLIQNDGRTVDRHTILRIIWDTNYYGSGRVLDDTIRRVRKKLPDLQIETVYGEGYRVSGL